MLTKLKNKYSSLPVQVRASLWFLITNFMQKAISVISTPIFTRLLTTEMDSPPGSRQQTAAPYYQTNRRQPPATQMQLPIEPGGNDRVSL